jgi:gluconate 5-dehydrogenase
MLKRSGHGVLPITADAFEEADIKRMLMETTKKFGKIDVVFAHAAIVETKKARIHEVSVEDWDNITSRYVRGIFMTMKYVFPMMMERKSGCFITTAAATGIWPMVPVGTLHFAAPYITGKAAVIMLTKLAARHYGEYGIRANIICPGYHRSLHHTSAPGMDEMEKFVLECTSLKRTGVADDIKGLAIYLASDASRFITGQIFIEDGGMVV